MTGMNPLRRCLFAASVAGLAAASNAARPSADDYPSLQTALDANPGRVVRLPGETVVSNAVVVSTDGSGISGPGRIVQMNPSQPVLVIRGAGHVRVEGVELTRGAGAEEATQPGLSADAVEHLTVDGVRVRENRSQRGAIEIHNSSHVAIRNCLVANYSTIGVDDRTGSGVGDQNYGYAFQCIDGTGILVKSSRGVAIVGNRVIEERLRPTPDMKDRHRLGSFTKRNERKGPLISQAAWDAGYVGNWHQGSAILVSSPETTDLVRIADNHIENAAQGIDIHADRVIVTGNFVHNAFMGMKAMHGARHVLIANNIFSRNSLWSIGLMPGAAAHAGNTDGDSIIAQNIISEFGRGDAAWMWPDGRPIRFDRGQMPDDPPLRNVLVIGNVISDPALDPPEGDPPGAPRYDFAVSGLRAAEGVVLENNLFPPGRRGVTD